MSSSHYTSPAGLTILQSYLQEQRITISGIPRVFSTLVAEFLTDPTNETSWNNMDACIQLFMSTYQPLLPDLRVMITLACGACAYDTEAIASGRNTYANFETRTIAENQNTRPEFLVALLGNSGSSYNIRFCTLTQKPAANNALRIGFSTSRPLGCCRVSVYNSTL
jgi:hypothetical protein